MKTRALIILLLWGFLYPGLTSAQIRAKYLKRYKNREIGISFGATNFIGELGGANRIGSEAFSIRDFDLPALRPVIGGCMVYQLSGRTFLKTGLSFGYLRGNDRYTEYISRQQRNINYRSLLIEFTEQYEFYLNQARNSLAKYRIQSARKRVKRSGLPFSTYLFTGVSFFYFNPQNKDKDGNWRFVKQYHTEGQGFVPTRKNYSLVQVAIPVGIGLKFPMGKGYTLGFEYGMRKTFTDYLDDASMTYFDETFLRGRFGQIAVDLSNPAEQPARQWLVPGQQRGDPRDKDFYLFFQITVYYDMSKVNRIRNFRF